MGGPGSGRWPAVVCGTGKPCGRSCISPKLKCHPKTKCFDDKSKERLCASLKRALPCVGDGIKRDAIQSLVDELCPPSEPQSPPEPETSGGRGCVCAVCSERLDALEKRLDDMEAINDFVATTTAGGVVEAEAEPVYSAAAEAAAEAVAMTSPPPVAEPVSEAASEAAAPGSAAPVLESQIAALQARIGELTATITGLTDQNTQVANELAMARKKIEDAEAQAAARRPVDQPIEPVVVSVPTSRAPLPTAVVPAVAAPEATPTAVLDAASDAAAQAVSSSAPPSNGAADPTKDSMYSDATDPTDKKTLQALEKVESDASIAEKEKDDTVGRIVVEAIEKEFVQSDDAQAQQQPTTYARVKFPVRAQSTINAYIERVKAEIKADDGGVVVGVADSSGMSSSWAETRKRADEEFTQFLTQANLKPDSDKFNKAMERALRYVYKVWLRRIIVAIKKAGNTGFWNLGTPPDMDKASAFSMSMYEDVNAKSISPETRAAMARTCALFNFANAAACANVQQGGLRLQS